MSTRIGRTGTAGDVWVGTAAVVALGGGSTVALGALAAGEDSIALVGLLVVGIALVILLAAEWISALAVVALSLPAPALYSTERARLAPAAVISAIVLVAWLASRTADGRRAAIGRVPHAHLLALLASVALSSLFAEYPQLAIRELLNWLVLLGLLVVATDLMSWKAHEAHSLARALATVAGLSGALAVLQMLGAFPSQFPLYGTPWNRADLGFGQPNALAMFLALALPFSVYACEQAHSGPARLLAVSGLVASGLGLVATFSRGSWLALLASTLVLLVLGDRRLVLRIWLAALAGLLALDVASSGAMSDRILGTLQDALVIQRLALTFAGLLMVQAHPLVGVGPGGFGENLERVGPQVSWLWDYVPSAHNGYVQMAAETGIIGTAALLFFLCATFGVLLRGARQARAYDGVDSPEAGLRRALVWSFAIVFPVSLVEWPFVHGVGQLIMLVAAAGFAGKRSGADEP